MAEGGVVGHRSRRPLAAMSPHQRNSVGCPRLALGRGRPRRRPRLRPWRPPWRRTPNALSAMGSGAPGSTRTTRVGTGRSDGARGATGRGWSPYRPPLRRRRAGGATDSATTGRRARSSAPPTA
jgi:hypothetical protein